MSKSYFVITGTSRGIGEALCKTLLDDGHYVCGISRGEAVELSLYRNYVHTYYDLSNLEDIDHLFDGLLAQMDFNEEDSICLVNNAAMVEPLKSIEECRTEEISKNLHISLLAPIILSSCFIRKTEKLQLRRKIVNISSGAGVYPLPDMSIYCTAKAGLNMFTRCIGTEQSKKEKPVEIISVEPGMVETEMQKTARGMGEDFAMAGFFKEAHKNGQLQSPESLAKDLKSIIYKEIETGRIMSYFES